MRFALVLCWCFITGMGCSATESASVPHRGAGGTTAHNPDSGIPAAGSGGSGGSAGSAGVAPKADAGRPYDRDAGFDWPEAVDAGKCQAGTYSGTYECRIDFNGISFLIDGKVSFELSPSPNGEFLEIKNGKLVADVEGQLTLLGDLVGKLDCAMNKFEATIQNGTYTFLFLGLLPITSPFHGDLAGVLDRLTSTMTGNWNLASGGTDAAGTSCTGPWNVTLQP